MFSSLNAQNNLSLKDAITKMLANNFDISISKNDWSIASMNNTKANAGMLPRVNINLSDNLSNNNLFQKFTNGTEIKRILYLEII
ncbi:MAG: TolC family protein [Saprospiraceae bacterium]|nr:TolC family protein [Saprospiraceae bacterium]